MTITQELSSLIHRVQELEDELKKSEEKLARAPGHDPLTKLPNKALFADRMKQAVARAYRSNKLMAILYLEVSFSRLVAAKYGDEATNSILQDLAERFKNSVRAVDTVSRFGEQSFAVIMEEVKEQNALTEIMNKILNIAQQDLYYKGAPVSVLMTVGGCLFDGKQYKDDGMLSKAIRALEEAKRDRKTYVIYQ